jgi:cysteinyl-tRNA synthetase
MTDIDDKIIQRAEETNQSPQALAQFFERDFFSDMVALGIPREKFSRVGRVTDHLHSIVKFIEKIQQNGFAYSVNGSVYFDSEKFGDRADKLLSLKTSEGEGEEVGYDSGDAAKDAQVKEKR